MDALIISAIFGIVMMFVSLFVKDKNTTANIAIVGFVFVAITAVLQLNGVTLFPKNATTDSMMAFGRKENFFILIVALLTIYYLLLCVKPLIAIGEYAAEYLSLLFFITCGIILCVGFQNMLMLFLGIEIISIPLYILTGSDKLNLKSNEASLKYFLMGAFSTGLLLMGITLLYGASSGTFNINALTPVEGSGVSHTLFYLLGIIFIFCSLCFKVSAAPFHFWTPDVYDGAPTPITAYMATIAKAAFFIAFVRLFQGTFSQVKIIDNWQYMLLFVITGTLIVGNFIAAFQESVKRMMAYSSIAQAGFMLFALMGAAGEGNDEGLYLYATTYTLATVIVFAVLMRLKDYTFDGFNGLAKTQPLAAAAVAVALMSLAGIPLTGGFMGKWYMLKAAVSNSNYWWMILIAVVLAAISVYYYFKIIRAMYFKPVEDKSVVITTPMKTMLLIGIGLIILLGVVPTLFTSYLWF
jgi:NADH-quinone oxidoreductase subunit N